MNCTAYTANDINQCAGIYHIGKLPAGASWTLRVVNVATGRTEYIAGTGTAIDVTISDLAPGMVYAFSVVDGTFIPFKSEGVFGTKEVKMIYAKVVKAFDGNGDILKPTDQWIILQQ